MRRGVGIALASLGIIAVVLAVALASIGQNLDRERIGRQDLQYTVSELKQKVEQLSNERDRLIAERDRIDKKSQDQLTAIEQLKAELDRLRNQLTAAESRMPDQPTAP